MPLAKFILQTYKIFRIFLYVCRYFLDESCPFFLTDINSFLTMLEKSIIIHAPNKLPEEQEEFELLVEELNTVLDTGGLLIKRVDWNYEPEDKMGADKNFCLPSSDDLFLFRLSGDIDTREVQFVLQLQVSLNALYRNMVTVGDNFWLEVFDKPMLLLKNLPFVCNTLSYGKIMERVQEAEQKDYSEEVLLNDFFGIGQDKPEEENTCEALKRKNVAQEMRMLTALETKLINVALTLARMPYPSAGPRWQKAEELFWNGETEKALAVLELPKIKTELRKASREGDRTTGEKLIMEAMLRIRLLQMDKPSWGHNVALEQEIVSIYKTCITCGRNCLPETALAGLTTEYAAFLEEIGQDRRSWIVYERVLPQWRTLANEDHNNCLPELARALYNYADLLISSYTFLVEESDVEVCFDDYWRKSTTESLFLEMKDIYQQLSEENPNAVLPLLAQTLFNFGCLLLNTHYVQRAQQFFSDAMDIFAFLAELYPDRYQSLLDYKRESIKHRMHDYSVYYDEKEISEEVHDILLKAKYNDPESQFQLGRLYQAGEEIIRDYDEAEKWLTRAAENGHVEAQRCMGLNYLNEGLGKKDIKIAEKWFRKAAMQGDSTAQFELAKICLDHNDQKSIDEALWWLQEAAEQECGEACFLLGKCYEYGTAVDQNYKKAAEWYLKGATECGELDCIYHLGFLYQYGKGVPQNYQEALRCFVTVKTWGFGYTGIQKQIDILLDEMKDTV